MTIRFDRRNQWFVIMLTIMLVVVFVIFVNVTKSPLISLILCAMPICLLVVYCVLTMRVFVFSEEGCVIRFLRFTRFYSWTELCSKRLIYYKNCWEYRSPYNKGVEFSIKAMRRPTWMKGATYSMLHPFSHVYVYFRNEKQHLLKGEYLEFHSANEGEFLNILNKWGIQLQEE